MFTNLSPITFALFHSLSMGGSNAAALIIAYVFTFQNKKVKEFFEIWFKIILLDILYLCLGIPFSVMAANITMIFPNPERNALSIMSASGAGLLWSATILSVSIIILLIRYRSKK